MFKVPDKHRIRKGKFGSDDSIGLHGAFFIPRKGGKAPFKIIATCGITEHIPKERHWEHVSVSLPRRCPTWEEMCKIKNIFWDDDDLVVQYHPQKTEYRNMAKHTLHLWRKTGTNDYCEKPPMEYV